jgi:hypothetical protein
MRLHRLDPSKDYAVAAFQTSERSRARALIETLAEARAKIQNGIDPALLAGELFPSLCQSLRARAEFRGEHQQSDEAPNFQHGIEFYLLLNR